MILAFEESAFELLDVTLAWEDDRLGVHRPDRRYKFTYSSRNDPENKLLKLATVWSIRLSVAIELSNSFTACSKFILKGLRPSWKMPGFLWPKRSQG